MRRMEDLPGFHLWDDNESVPTADPQARKQAEKKKSQQKQQTPQDTKTMEEKALPERSAQQTPQDFTKQQTPQDFTKQQSPHDFTKTMEEKVSMAIPEWSAEPPTICEVPGDLAEGNTGAYTPKVVCIGPLFGSKRTTADMLRLERYKWCCVRKLIVGRNLRLDGSLEPADWSPDVHAPVLRQCFEKMMRLVPRVRASYCSISASTDTSGSGTNDQDLALIMLLDGCFVLDRLLKYARKAKRSSGEGNGGMDDDDDDWTQVLGRCWIWGSVTRDLLLLANQVPFFVVRKLFKHLMSNVGQGDDVLVHGGLRFFRSLHPRRMHSAPIACDEVHHLLHMFYLSIDLPPRPSPSMNDPHESTRRHAAQPSSELTRWMPCAKELEEAGVQFQPRKRGAASFLDVRFCGGVLEIPPLELYDYSEPLFRNLIAFEQTYPPTQGRVTAYAIFMDCLLKTAEDGRLLHKSGVLVNHMNGVRDDTAMGFFSRICKEAHSSADRNYLQGVMDEVAKYQSARWPRWRAALESNYLTNPWVITSVIAAAFLLALTVLQSFYSVYGYYKPAK